jgi:hypothetical protein
MENKKQKSRKRIVLIAAGLALLAGGISGYFITARDKDKNNFTQPQVIYPLAEVSEQSNEEYPANPQNIGHNQKEDYTAEEPPSITPQPNKGLARIVANKPTQRNRKPLEKNAGAYKPQTLGNNPNPQYTDKETGENPPLAEPPAKEKEKILTKSIRKAGVEQELRVGPDSRLYLEITNYNAPLDKRHSYVLLEGNDGPVFEYTWIYTSNNEPRLRERGFGFLNENGWLVLGTRKVMDILMFTERSSDKGELEDAQRIVYDDSWKKIRTDYSNLESKLNEELRIQAIYIMGACQNGRAIAKQ